MMGLLVGRLLRPVAAFLANPKVYRPLAIVLGCMALFWGGMAYQKLQYADIAREAAEQVNADTAIATERHLAIERDINERLKPFQGESGDCTWSADEREWLYQATRPLPTR